MALELRPNCEYCDVNLPLDSTEARICTYECTFCVSCVETVLANVCPNCGGGFERRPIRPRNEWRPGLSAALQPAPTKRHRALVFGRGHRRLLRAAPGHPAGATMMLVDIVVYDGLDELDALGPLEVLRSGAALGVAVTARLVTPGEQPEVTRRVRSALCSRRALGAG